MEEKICPIFMLLSAHVKSTDSPEAIKSIILCQREKCAWWNKFYDGEGECVIFSLREIPDAMSIF